MLTQKGFSFWAFIAAALIILAGIVTGTTDLIKLGNVLLGYAIAALFAVAWLEFYMTRREKTDAKIASNPLALAVYSGSVVIAGAITSTLL